jgi:hypothetical protein
VSESKSIHWVENEDLLEEFVLGRLERAEMARLTAHLDECDQCRKTVSNELLLVAGIRFAGRDAVKDRLAQRIEERKSKNVGWYRMVGVAAGIVLLVTVGIYNRWFIGTETQTEKQSRADTTEKRIEPAPLVAPQGQATNAEKPHVYDAKRARDQEAQTAPSVAAAVPKTAGAESGRIAGSQADKLGELKAMDAVRGGERSEKNDRAVAATAVSAIAPTWVEGTVITEGDQNRPAVQELAANAKDERSVLRKGKAENFLAGKGAGAGMKENVVQTFIFNQRPLTDLPSSQRRQQQNTSSVQTLLEKNSSGTNITVFLDSLLTKKEFDQTHVQTIGEDSIILNLGNRLVGYKLPPDWTGQGVQQTRRQK